MDKQVLYQYPNVCKQATACHHREPHPLDRDRTSDRKASQCFCDAVPSYCPKCETVIKYSIPLLPLQTLQRNKPYYPYNKILL